MPVSNQRVPLEEIKRRIQITKEDAAGQGIRKFMPRNCLQQLLTTEVVASALTNPEFGIAQHKLQDTADIVIREGTSVFSILLELNLEKRLVTFIENDMLDSALPLHTTDLEAIIPEAVATFETLQWDYLAYRFRKGQYHRKIKPKEILPYLEEKRIGGGGFSSVFKVLVHSAHQDLIAGAGNKVGIVMGYSSNPLIEVKQ